MSRLLVLGAGGHAKVVADVARLRGFAVHAFVDELADPLPAAFCGLPVLRSVDEVPGAAVALGLGNNRLRLERHRSLRRAGREVVTLLHPSAMVAEGVSIGAGTLLAAGVVVNSDTVLGEAVILNTGCSVDHDCVVGDGAHVAPGSRLAGGVEVGEGALLGIASCAVPGLVIGAWAVCGAGAVVVRDVSPASTVKGVPAR